MGTFDSPSTKLYVGRCIGLVETIVSNTQPQLNAEDLVEAIQSELKTPSQTSELPPVGVLGLCVNVITIVRNDFEDPIESIMKAFSDSGVEAVCFPGSCERQQ
jgi:hypothetical protein